MQNNQCAVKDCTDDAYCKGFCNMHYRRMKRSGNPVLIVRDCRECANSLHYESAKGRRRFLCDDCVARHRQAHADRYNHRQKLAAAGEDPEWLVRMRGWQFKNNIKRYGITPDEFHAMVIAQENRCAICGESPPADGEGAYSRLHIDHDHDTKTVRGLLCGQCNIGIGAFRDDPVRLLAAVQYLQAATVSA